MTSELDETSFAMKFIAILFVITFAFFALKYFASDESHKVNSSSLNIEVRSMTEENLLGTTRHFLQITSKDEKSFTLNKIIFNKRATQNCTVKFISQTTNDLTSKKSRTYLLGDVEKIYLPEGCGDEILAVDIDSDRGEFSYHFET